MPQPRLAAKRAGLPPIATQQRIAGAVHQVIAEEFGDIAHQMCSYYAAIGTTVASVITRRNYMCQVGSLMVTTMPDAEMGDGRGDAVLAMMADDPLVPGLEFHAWFAGQFGQRTEIVDLASRHYETNARALMMPWSASVHYPQFIWASGGTTIPGIRLIPNEQARSAWGDGFLKPRKGHVVDLSRRALRIYGA